MILPCQGSPGRRTAGERQPHDQQTENRQQDQNETSHAHLLTFCASTLSANTGSLIIRRQRHGCLSSRYNHSGRSAHPRGRGDTGNEISVPPIPMQTGTITLAIFRLIHKSAVAP